MMRREQVLQGLLDVHEEPTYLEIGVHSGVTFHSVRAARKVAVDPDFRFELPEQAVTYALEYHPVYSDAYFGRVVEAGRKFDVIYLDGLHTVEQTLRDLLNAVDFLEDDGVIVVDDVVPTSYAAALPNHDDFLLARSKIPIEEPHEAWMGDVYKLVFFVEAFMQGFTYAVVEENHGQMILWRQTRSEVGHPLRTLGWIGGMDMTTMLQNQTDMRQMSYGQIREAYILAVQNKGKAAAGR